MYSLANRCTQWNASILFPLVSLFFVLTLSACTDDKSFPPPDEIKDTTPPTILSSIPNEATSTGFEVDYAVEIVFSERMNLDSLTTEGGVKLFAGKIEEAGAEEENVVDQELMPREASISLSEVPVTSEDLITGEEIVVPATKLTLRHNTGRFALDAAYTVMVESPARDIVEDDPETAEDDRNYIDGTNSIDFITQKGSWKTIRPLPNVRIEVDSDESEHVLEISDNRISPRVIANNKGDAFALWLQEGSIAGVNQLWISRYLVNEKKWALLDPEKLVCSIANATNCANAERVDNNDSTSVIDYQAVANDIGQIAIVWSQAAQAGGPVAIHARLFDGLNWLNVNEISSSGLSNQAGNADSPRVVMDQSGNVLAIWREHTGITTRIKTNIYQVADGAWTEAPAFIDDGTGSSTQTPELAISQSGRAMAVWSQNQNGRLRIFSNRIRLSQSSDWQSPVQIDEINSSSVEYAIGDSTKPKIAIDDNGDALAVWLKFDGQRNNVWYNRFTGNWGTRALPLEADRRGDAESPLIRISRDNKGLVVWKQRTNNLTELKARMFLATTGWQDEKTVTNAAQIHKPVARFDREGNAHLIWQDGQAKGQLNTSYYSKLTDTWSEVAPFSSENNANNASIVPVYEDGRFLSAWETIDGLSKQLFFNTFSD